MKDGCACLYNKKSGAFRSRLQYDVVYAAECFNTAIGILIVEW
jgi:hypothetical protein